MHRKIYTWLGREFLALSCEAAPEGPATQQAVGLFARLAQELSQTGLSLENVVRTRLWARDRESRNQASNERARVLAGKARSASSSFIAPDHFESQALVAMDLLAMRPVQAGTQKILKEYEPPIVPLRYLVYDSVVFLSGVTAVLPDLEKQVADIIPRISGSLADAGTSWDKAAKASCFLHRSKRATDLGEIFRAHVKATIPRVECQFVDGYSSEGKLVEIEITAVL
jgi:enamine deaminase RidA (YjgF/YER057c/UK114 family)